MHIFILFLFVTNANNIVMNNFVDLFLGYDVIFPPEMYQLISDQQFKKEPFSLFYILKKKKSHFLFIDL